MTFALALQGGSRRFQECRVTRLSRGEIWNISVANPGVRVGQPIDLGCIEVGYPERPHRVTSGLSPAELTRRWKTDNRERYLESERARYRRMHPRTCKGVGDESCHRDVTGTGKQRCTWHAYLQDLVVRKDRRDRKKEQS